MKGFLNPLPPSAFGGKLRQGGEMGLFIEFIRIAYHTTCDRRNNLEYQLVILIISLCSYEISNSNAMEPNQIVKIIARIGRS